MIEERISLPRTILTDAESVSVNVVDEVFPALDRMLCLWHILLGNVDVCDQRVQVSQSMTD